jgi:hypothetical protein
MIPMPLASQASVNPMKAIHQRVDKRRNEHASDHQLKDRKSGSQT